MQLLGWLTLIVMDPALITGHPKIADFESIQNWWLCREAPCRVWVVPAEFPFPQFREGPYHPLPVVDLVGHPGYQTQIVLFSGLM